MRRRHELEVQDFARFGDLDINSLGGRVGVSSISGEDSDLDLMGSLQQTEALNVASIDSDGSNLGGVVDLVGDIVLGDERLGMHLRKVDLHLDSPHMGLGIIIDVVKCVEHTIIE